MATFEHLNIRVDSKLRAGSYIYTVHSRTTLTLRLRLRHYNRDKNPISLFPEGVSVKRQTNYPTTRSMCSGRGNAYGQHDFANCWTEPQCMKRSDPLNGCTSRKTFFVVGTTLALFAAVITATVVSVL
jgi:hypothetical protein